MLGRAHHFKKKKKQKNMMISENSRKAGGRGATTSWKTGWILQGQLQKQPCTLVTGVAGS